MLFRSYWLGSQCRSIGMLHSAQVGGIGVYIPVEDATKKMELEGVKIVPISSGKYKLLGHEFHALTEEEIKDNEQMWREERDNPELETKSGQDLRSVGITPAGLESDIATGEEVAGMGPGGGELPPEAPMGGAGGAAPAGSAAPPAA